ncbi:MAG: hypothetical protein HQK95_05230 [Nitrospirae bacterium]|nr:hypothetical protein [Nitrospirota bacterium]
MPMTLTQIEGSLDSCFRRNDRQGRTNEYISLSFLRKQESSFLLTELTTWQLNEI